MYIDCHAHLCDEAFSGDLSEVISRARGIGVCGVIVATEHPGEYSRALSLGSEYPDFCFPCAGLYPSNLSELDWEQFESSVRGNPDSWFGLGEVGLDRWILKEDWERARNEEIFRRVVSLGIELDLCLNIHSRSAGRYVLDILEEACAVRVHLHAFDAKLSTVRRGLDSGYKFSIPTSVVHSVQKQKLARYLPEDAILLETDSPVMGVDRDRRNEPSEIYRVIDMLAELRGADKSVLANVIYRNSVSLYKLPLPVEVL